MEILNLGGAAESNTPAPKSRKKLRVIFGIGALAAVTGLGSTLAANISLNGGGNVEFGQGVATTAACDDDITLTPVSTFSNTYEDATFAMTAIQVSGIDLTPEGWNADVLEWNSNFNRETRTWSGEDADRSGQYQNSDGIWTSTCEGKVLMLRAYTDNYPEKTVGNNIESPLYLNGSSFNRPTTNNGRNSGYAFKLTQDWETNQVGYYDNDYLVSTYVDTYDYYEESATDLDWNIDGNNSSVVIDLDLEPFNPPLDARWVDKLTIESAAEIPSRWNWDL